MVLIILLCGACLFGQLLWNVWNSPAPRYYAVVIAVALVGKLLIAAYHYRYNLQQERRANQGNPDSSAVLPKPGAVLRAEAEGDPIGGKPGSSAMGVEKREHRADEPKAQGGDSDLLIVHGVRTPPNDPSSATRPTRASDCNRDAMAGFAAAPG